MVLISFLACVTYKYQISALETQIGIQQQQISAQQEQINALEKKVDQVGDNGNNEPSQEDERKAQELMREVMRLYDAGNIEEAKQKLEYGLQEYGNTKTATRLSRIKKELDVIGKEAPENWGNLEMFQGEWSYNADAVTLVVFWEIWCPHCKKHIPELQNVYQANKDRGLDVVGMTKLTRNATKEEVMTFVTEKEVKYPILLEDGTSSSYFNVSGIPAAALLKDGKVVWRGHPAVVTTHMLDKYLQ
jgi:thiol-disulfide isomerase/thioredoxin